MSQSKAKLTAQFFYKQFWASVQSEEKQATLDVFLFLQLSAENLLSAFWVNLQRVVLLTEVSQKGELSYALCSIWVWSWKKFLQFCYFSYDRLMFKAGYRKSVTCNTGRCVKRLCDYLLYLWSYVKMLEKANKAKLESTTTPKYSEYKFCMVSLNMVKYGKVIVR